MDAILQTAETVLRRILDEAIEAGAPIASDIDVRHGYDLRTDRHRFCLAACAFRGEFRVDHFAMMQLTPATRSNLANTIRSMWRAMTAERMRTALAPPRLTVAEGALAAIDWGRYDGMVFVDEFAAIPPEAFFGGPAGGAMASNNQAPEPQPALTMETMRQVLDGMRGGRFMGGGAIDRDGRPCTCRHCRPDLRRSAELEEQERARTFDLIEREYRTHAAMRRPESYGPEERRSIALLKEWLSPDQLASYETDWFFDVTASGGQRYRIYQRGSTNVAELDDKGIGVRLWCFGPDGDPGKWVGDVMLAQKLALETDEEGVLAVANRVSGPPREGERARPMPPPLNPFGLVMGPADLF